MKLEVGVTAVPTTADTVCNVGTIAGGKGGGGGGAGELTVMVMLAVAFGLVPFAAWTVNENVPALVGVPARTPVEGSKVSPGGKLPELTVNAMGAVPEAANVYAG